VRHQIRRQALLCSIARALPVRGSIGALSWENAEFSLTQELLKRNCWACGAPVGSDYRRITPSGQVIAYRRGSDQNPRQAWMKPPVANVNKIIKTAYEVYRDELMGLNQPFVDRALPAPSPYPQKKAESRTSLNQPCEVEGLTRLPATPTIYCTSV